MLLWKKPTPTFSLKAEAIKTKATEAQFAENKAAGEKFLAENAKKEGVKTTSSGFNIR